MAFQWKGKKDALFQWAMFNCNGKNVHTEVFISIHNLIVYKNLVSFNTM